MAETMDDPRDLFFHELGDILYAERTITKLLPTFKKEVTDQELKDGFDRHLEETKGQISNVEQVFKSMGEKVKAERCPGIDGIKQEHDQFVEEEKPSPDVLQLFVTGSAARVEHYEIASYSGLVAAAKAMGETEAAALLEENLKQEQQMAKDGEKIAKRLLKASAGQAASA